MLNNFFHKRFILFFGILFVQNAVLILLESTAAEEVLRIVTLVAVQKVFGIPTVGSEGIHVAVVGCEGFVAELWIARGIAVVTVHGFVSTGHEFAHVELTLVVAFFGVFAAFEVVACAVFTLDEVGVFARNAKDELCELFF